MKRATAIKRLLIFPKAAKFESVRDSFLHRNGMGDGKGDTEIYMDMYRQMKSDDRLSAGYTLGQYHSAYAQAFISAVKAVDSGWTYGKSIPSGALDGITRESIENALVQKGNTFAGKTVDYYV